MLEVLLLLVMILVWWMVLCCVTVEVKLRFLLDDYWWVPCCVHRTSIVVHDCAFPVHAPVLGRAPGSAGREE